MAIETKPIKVSKPLWDVLKLVEEVVADGLDPQHRSELFDDLRQAMGQLNALTEIKADAAVDFEAVKNTLMLCGDDLVTRVMGILKKGDVSNPGQ